MGMRRGWGARGTRRQGRRVRPVWPDGRSVESITRLSINDDGIGLWSAVVAFAWKPIQRGEGVQSPERSFYLIM
jgi:hypothetical protein